jgi:hypothetical protein
MRKLNDITKIKKVIKDFLIDTRPTISGLCIKLGVTPVTLFKYIEDFPDDPITEQLISAYQHIVNTWESKLFDKGSQIPAIFYLKTIRRFGYRWNDSSSSSSQDQSSSSEAAIQNRLKFEYEIVKRDDKK